MRKKNKIGDATPWTLIIGISFLIAGFIVVLYFLGVFNFGETKDDELCHESVLLRSTHDLTTYAVPLDCKTGYLCISADGTCESMTSPTIKKVTEVSDVYKILGEEMTNCWWMFGEGNVKYVSEQVTSELYCSICDQIGFDDSLKTLFSNGNISKASLYGYLAVNNVSGEDTTYLNYLLGTSTSQEITRLLKQDSSDYGKLDLTFGNIVVGKRYFVVMGVFNDISAWKTAVTAGLGGAALVAGSVIVIAATAGAVLPAVPFIIAFIAGGTAGSTQGYLIAVGTKGNTGKDYLSPSIIEANSEDYNKLQCVDVVTLS